MLIFGPLSGFEGPILKETSHMFRRSAPFLTVAVFLTAGLIASRPAAGQG